MSKPPDLTHTDDEGRVRMVDVGGKPTTQRRAVARGVIRTTEAVVNLVISGTAPKGDVLATARIAGIQGAKRTSEWIPLCHPVGLDSTSIDIRCSPENDITTASGSGPGFEVTAEVTATGTTGVEMEALTAVSATLLSLYDMLKAADRGMELGGIHLLVKEGGRSGHWKRQD